MLILFNSSGLTVRVSQYCIIIVVDLFLTFIQTHKHFAMSITSFCLPESTVLCAYLTETQCRLYSCFCAAVNQCLCPSLVSVQDDRPPNRNHHLRPGQEGGGQKPAEAAQGPTEDEKLKRGRLRRQPLPPPHRGGQRGGPVMAVMISTITWMSELRR